MVLNPIKMTRHLDDFVDAHGVELTEIYDKVHRYTKLPQLYDCEQDYRRIGIENDLPYNLINDPSFLLALHLKVRELHKNLDRTEAISHGMKKLESSESISGGMKHLEPSFSKGDSTSMSLREMASTFAKVNADQLVLIYRKAKKRHPLPRMEDSEADYRRLVTMGGMALEIQSDIDFLQELHLFARSLYMNAKEKKWDVLRAARELATDNVEQLLLVYETALKKNDQPKLIDCRAGYASLARERGMQDDVVNDDKYMMGLHIFAKRFSDEKIKKEQKAKELEAKFNVEFSKLTRALSEHGPVLCSRARRSIQRDPYGTEISNGTDTEIRLFLRSQQIGSNLPAESYSKLIGICRKHISNFEKSTRDVTSLEHRHNLASGEDFELWVSDKLRMSGWTTEFTPASGDQGVDIIAKKGVLSIAVQCKYYAGSVGNKAVQEVFAGMRYLGLEHAVVISTGNYTKSAEELARTTGVHLLAVTDIPILYELVDRNRR